MFALTIVDRRFSNGSKIVYLCVTLMDIVLANVLFMLIVNGGFVTVPERLVGENLVCMICATAAALVGVTLYGNIIYNSLDMCEYIKFLNETDPTVLKATEILMNGESVPQVDTPDTITKGKTAYAMPVIRLQRPMMAALQG